MAELAALSGDSSNDSNTVSSITEKSQNAVQNNGHTTDSKDAANTFQASAATNQEQILPQDQVSNPAGLLSPADKSKHESSITNDNTSKIYSDAVLDIEDHDATTDTAYADATLADPITFAANDDAAPEHQEIQREIQQDLRQQSPTNIVHADQSDSDRLIDEDVSISTTSDLDTGVGRSFMVFNRHGELKGVKRGVSWPALFFTFPWLLSKALFGTAVVYGFLWLVSLGGLLVSANRWFIAGAETTIDIKLWAGAFAILAIIGLLYIPFRYGNRWVAEKLQNRGFNYEGSVSAESKLDAVDRLLEYNEEKSL